MLISNVLKVTNNDHWQPTVQGLPQAPVLSGVLLVGRAHLALGSPGRGCCDFLVVVPDGPQGACPVSRRLESVFFAFVKFIMCLLVPEVKAVSCARVIHMQVLESYKKNRLLEGLAEGL